MLFIESKSSDYAVENALRMALLEKLQAQGLTPLIRSTRLYCYELALAEQGPERLTQQMERSIANWTEAEGESPYISGELFCYEDYAFFLLFGDTTDKLKGMRAGIVHGVEHVEPLRYLDGFCRKVDDALRAVHMEQGGNGEAAYKPSEWRLRESCVPPGIARFFSGRESNAEALNVPDKAAAERLHAVELLEDADARRILRRISEAHEGGRVAEFLSEEGQEETAPSSFEKLTDSSIEKFSRAGLLKREVLVRCHQTGRALFRLPSTDALSVITASGAVCSECNIPIADEKAEELLAPTPRATALLEDGLWLASRLHYVLLKLGIPENQITIYRPSAAQGEPYGQGETYMMAHLCDESFLFVLRDGDWTTAHARRTLNMESETEASHVIVVATGRIQDEGRIRLREGARRQARGGSEVEVLLVEGIRVAVTQLQEAFERVSQRALAEELCVLDGSLGLSVGRMLSTRFNLVENPGALKDLAAAAASAVAGSLREG
jgi:hypothetical protein